MFVLQKKILFARGLNWDQSRLWKTPPSHFLLFSPLACPYFFNFFSSPDFWGVKEAPCKNLYVFGENWQRNQFPKLTTFLLHFSPMSPLCHSALKREGWLSWQQGRWRHNNVWLHVGKEMPSKLFSSPIPSGTGAESDAAENLGEINARNVVLIQTQSWYIGEKFQ